MAMSKMIEGLVRSKAQEQIGTFLSLGTDVETIKEGMAVVLEELAAAYKTVPEDVIAGAQVALKRRAAAREAAAAAKANQPSATEVLFGLFGKKK